MMNYKEIDLLFKTKTHIRNIHSMGRYCLLICLFMLTSCGVHPISNLPITPPTLHIQTNTYTNQVSPDLTFTPSPIPSFTLSSLVAPPTKIILAQTISPTPSLTDTPTIVPRTPISDLNVSSLKLLHRLGLGMNYDVIYSLDNRYLGVATSFGVSIYDARTLEIQDSFETDHRQLCLAFSPDGSLVASGSDQGVIQVWQLDGNPTAQLLKGQSGAINAIAFSPDGKLLASGSNDGTLFFWQVNDGQLIKSIKASNIPITNLAFSPDGSLLATGVEKSISMWRVSTGKLAHTFQGQTKAVKSVAFSPDGLLLAAASLDGLLNLWRVDNGSLFLTIN